MKTYKVTMIWDWIKTIRRSDYLTYRDYKEAVESMKSSTEQAKERGCTTDIKAWNGGDAYVFYIKYPKETI